MSVHIYKNIDVLTLAVAEEIVAFIGKKLNVQDRFTWLLSGGNTPKKLYSLLATDLFKFRIDWNRIHIFFGDERVVPYDDDRNNGKMARESLIDHVPIPGDHVHYIAAEKELTWVVDDYEILLHHYFDGETTSFDLSLLGMGDDGHTLSLFPGSPLLHEQNRWVVSLYLEAQKMYRISLTSTIVNRSDETIFLVTGASKASALKKVLQGSFQPELYPAQLIKPLNKQLHWYIDEAAGNEL